MGYISPIATSPANTFNSHCKVLNTYCRICVHAAFVTCGEPADGGGGGGTSNLYSHKIF